MSALLETLSKIYSSDADSGSQKEKLAAISSLLLDLKVQNREAYTRLKNVKRQAQFERSSFDDLAISLQSVQYERQHLESEIKACLAYKSIYDSVDLVPVEGYLESMADEGIDEDEIDGHKLMITRLNDELGLRKELKDCVKVAEIKRDAESDRLQKLYKELENLRDHAKTIYKMAASYKLTETAVRAEGEREGRRPLQRVYDEFLAFVGERDEWRVEMVPALVADKDEEEEEGALEELEQDVMVDEAGSKNKFRFYDHAYIQVFPSPDIFDGAVLLFQPTPSSPIILSLQQEGLENPLALLHALPLDSSLSFHHTSDMDMETAKGLAYVWVQVAAGLDSSLAFADSHQCISAFFEALGKASSDTMDTC